MGQVAGGRGGTSEGLWGSWAAEVGVTHTHTSKPQGEGGSLSLSRPDFSLVRFFHIKCVKGMLANMLLSSRHIWVIENRRFVSKGANKRTA